MKYIYLLIFVILTSCGSRKVVKNEYITQKEEVITEKVITTDTSNVEIRFNYQSEIFTIEAKDNLKPFTYNGKTYFNVVLRHENKKDNSLYKKDVKVSKIEDKQSNIKSKEVIKQKNIERDNYNIKYFILLFILLLIILFYIYKRYFKIIL
jgi:ATP-dependent Zn protease